MILPMGRGVTVPSYPDAGLVAGLARGHVSRPAGEADHRRARAVASRDGLSPACRTESFPRRAYPGVAKARPAAGSAVDTPAAVVLSIGRIPVASIAA
jgi:hypothetical protein